MAPAEIGIDLPLRLLTLRPKRLAGLSKPSEIFAARFQIDVEHRSVPHRADLSLEAGVRLRSELLPTLAALSPPGAIRLPGQDDGAADHLAGDPMKRDGNELLFHCLPPGINPSRVLMLSHGEEKATRRSNRRAPLRWPRLSPPVSARQALGRRWPRGSK